MKKYYLIIIIFFAVSNPVFGQAQNINAFVSEEQTVNGFSNFFLGVDFFESYIATNPRDPLNTICAFIQGGYFTLDGLHWQRLSFLNSGDPFLTFDSIGNAYYTPAPPWVNDLRLLKSTNKGVTWPFSYYLSHDNDNDKTCICGNKSGGPYSNYLYASWSIPSTGEWNHNLMFKKSTDLGVNWSNQDMGHLGYCSYLAIGPSSTNSGGMIYYGYSIFDTSNMTIHRIGLRTSQDGGINFSTPAILSTFIHPENLKNDSIYIFDSGSCMQMAADNSYGPYRGNVYIVYCGKGSGIDKADIFFLKSTNYGVNWTTPFKLNDDNTTNDQWMPALSVDKVGQIYVDWYDSRFDPQNRMTKLYGTVSTNGGETFVPDFPISTIPFDPVRIAWYEPIGVTCFMGDYISVSGIKNTAITSWTDGRNNTRGSYVSYFPDFAMTHYPADDTLMYNDSTYITIKVPAKKGPFNSRINFNAYIDPVPANGNISLSFLNGKDYVTDIPDSVILKVKSTSSATPDHYTLYIIGKGPEGVPVHERSVKLLVNYLTGQINSCSNKYKPIIDLQIIADTIQILQSGMVHNVKVSLNINHSDDGDMLIMLTHQDKTVILSQYNGAGGQNYTNTIFDDSAAIPISQGTPPFTGSFKPQTSLSDLMRKDISGNWILRIYDKKTGDQGALLNWCLQIAYVIPIGIKVISSEVVKKYELLQNYPNPFNPATKIRFCIPPLNHPLVKVGSGVVTLKIYDITGREIQTLVKEKLYPGTYEVTFDGSNFASGVYFYQLRTGDFVNTKKLILMK